jgi:hypothetical protein
MRLLVCGGRTYGYTPAERQALHEALAAFKPTVVIHGAAAGADSVADKWAKVRGIEVLAFPADWKRYAYAAGPIRNAQMLEEGKPDIVLAAPGGKGTADMVKKAKIAGVRVFTFDTIKDYVP